MRYARVLLFLLSVCWSSKAFGQEPALLKHHLYKYPQTGISVSVTDSFFNEEGSRMVVRRGKKVIFRGNFIRIESHSRLHRESAFLADWTAGSPGPRVFRMDSSTSVFLFTTWSDGAHCCRTIYSALVDSSGFRLKDTVFLCDGYYGYRHLDSSGIPLIVANIDFFPYSWTSFSGTEFNVAVFAITKTGLQNVTARYPKLVKRDMRGFRKSIRACKQAITQTEIAEDLETNQMEEMGPQWIGELKQELACLLISYRSLHRESEGWAEIERQYTFKGRQRFLRALKKLLPEHLKRYGSQFE